MAKIDKSESNLYPLPKGANVVKTGAVYINNTNYRVEPKDGRKPYVSHIKLCIGKISENDKTRFYANDNYKRKFLNMELPEKEETALSLDVRECEIDKTVGALKEFISEKGYDYIYENAYTIYKALIKKDIDKRIADATLYALVRGIAHDRKDDIKSEIDEKLFFNKSMSSLIFNLFSSLAL